MPTFYFDPRIRLMTSIRQSAVLRKESMNTTQALAKLYTTQHDSTHFLCNNVNPCPAEPGYILPLQTE